MVKVITTDSGKKFCKGTSDGISISRFESKLDTLKKPDYSYRNMIELDDSYYLLGEEASTVSYDSTKEIMLHKLSVYYNVCKHVDTFGEEVNLVVNMPITHFMNVEQRESFRQYIKGDQEIDIRIGQKSHYFYINDVLPIAEGTGIIFSRPDLFKDKNVIVCNLGGLNSTCLQVANKKIVRDVKPFITNSGGNILEADIRNELNRNGKFNFQQHEIQYLFKSEKPYIKDAIKYCSEKLLDGIITDMKSHNYNVEGCEDIVFEGGTSLRLQDTIRDMGFTVVDDPINTDIKGAHLYGVKTFG